MKYLWYGFLGLFSIGILGLIAGVAVIIGAINYYSQDLPDYSALKTYDPPIVTRLYAGDGRLMAEYAQEKRVFVPINSIPDLVKHAFIAAEDKNFYQHEGVDPAAIVRAGLNNFLHTGARMKGASTITQQVAKNFLLGNERSYSRKIREVILAYRMEQAMSKDHLLELYLNQIYLGARAYGVGAAALQYFNKSLDELSVAEVAYLAELPKAPNNYNPDHNYDAAVDRRNYVIDRMLEDNYITADQATEAKATPLKVAMRDSGQTVNAPFFAEEVRRELSQRYGEDSLYKGGLVVRTTLDPRLQDIALRALRAGLQSYDQRHGYRGAFKHFDTMGDWKSQLAAITKPIEMPDDWKLAAAINGNTSAINLGFADGNKGTLKLANLKWARTYLNEGYSQGPEITDATQVVKSGDIIMVEPIKGEQASYGLRQIPLLQGAVIAMDPHTGRILAMQGGWKYIYGGNEYNRVTQAHRQPGSAFKPFIYTAALEHGFTPSSLIMDGPFVLQDRPGHFWSPVNYHGDFLGPITMRVALEKSRNLATIRLANNLGMDMVADYAKRFGIVDDMPLFLANSLGAQETTPLRLAAAYATFVNGGKKIAPTVLDRIQDRRGTTIFRHDDRVCASCGNLIKWESQDTPDVPDARPQIIDPRTAYQMTHILEGVAQRGTAADLKSLNLPLAGKTGTTNKSRDTWFMGFSPDLLVGVFMGFDDPRSLGKKETGASVAVPVFKQFMAEALKNEVPTPFRIPPGIKNIQIDAATGKPTEPGDKNDIWEAYIAGTGPSDNQTVLDGGGVGGAPSPDQVTTGDQGSDENDAADEAVDDKGDSAGPVTPANPFIPPAMPATPSTLPPTGLSIPAPSPVSPPSPTHSQPSGDDSNTGTGGIY